MCVVVCGKKYKKRGHLSGVHVCVIVSLLFDIIPEEADDDGSKTNDFRKGSTDGMVQEVVNKPSGRIDCTQGTNLTGIGQIEGNGQRTHADGGQQLHNKVAQGRLCAEYQKGQPIANHLQTAQDCRPDIAVGARAVSFIIDQAADNADGVEQATGICFYQQKMQAEQNASKQLADNQRRFFLLLIRCNDECKTDYADNLCDGIHKKHLFI